MKRLPGRGGRKTVWTRRAFLGAGFAAVGAAIVAARVAVIKEAEAMGDSGRLKLEGTETDGGRLLARPGRPVGPAPTGPHALKLGGRRDALLYVPAGYRADRPAPMAVM